MMRIAKSCRRRAFASVGTRSELAGAEPARLSREYLGLGCPFDERDPLNECCLAAESSSDIAGIGFSIASARSELDGLTTAGAKMPGRGVIGEAALTADGRGSSSLSLAPPPIPTCRYGGGMLTCSGAQQPSRGAELRRRDGGAVAPRASSIPGPDPNTSMGFAFDGSSGRLRYLASRNRSWHMHAMRHRDPH